MLKQSTGIPESVPFPHRPKHDDDPMRSNFWYVCISSIDIDHTYQALFSHCSQNKKIRKLKRKSHYVDCSRLNFKDSHVTSPKYHLWLTCYGITHRNSVTFGVYFILLWFLFKHFSKSWWTYLPLFRLCRRWHGKIKHLVEKKKSTFVPIHRCCQWSLKCPKLN